MCPDTAGSYRSNMTVTTEPTVTVRGLCKSYGERVVVDHVDLDVADGEILGLLGANGAGKTTTVECIQGLRAADAGHIRVLGLDPIRDQRALRPRLGVQLQDSALPDRLRVDEAINLFVRRRVPAIDGLVEAFGLTAQRRQAFGSLSGGQRQRLFLVLALLNQPQLVVLDELTQGLDPSARRDVWDAIRALRDAGTTVLLVTHYMDEAEVLCDRVAVMRAGRIVDTGTPRALIDRHARWAVLRFTSPCPTEVGQRIRPITGVHAVTVDGDTVEVHGDRTMVAYVGAALAREGPVPEDLWVKVPDLEDAVIGLLERQPDVHKIGAMP
jgi:ABC-2 type transport system ATP-binding protein